MRTRRDVLTDGERVVLAVRPHGWVLLGPLLLLGTFGPLTLLVAGFVPPGRLAPWLRFAVLAAGGLVLTGTSVLPVLRWWATSYTVTTHRVLAARGLLRRVRREVRLADLQTIRVRSAGWGRMFGSGRIRLEAGPVRLALDDVPTADRVARAILEQADRFAVTPDPDGDVAAPVGDHRGGGQGAGQGGTGRGDLPADGAHEDDAHEDDEAGERVDRVDDGIWRRRGRGPRPARPGRRP